MKKDNKKLIISLISVIVILSIISIISILYNFFGGFYFGRIVKYNTMLGEDITMVVENGGVYSVSCNFSGTLVLDKNFKQKVTLEFKQMPELNYVRAKAHISGIGGTVKMTGVTNWIVANDGYYYFNQNVKSYENIQLCNNLMFDSNLNLNSYKDYILTFIIEISDQEWNYDVI